MNPLKSLQALAVVLVTAMLPLSAAFAQLDAWSESYQLESAGKYAEAQAQIEPLAARQPANEFAVMRTAWLLYRQGKHADAEKRYMKAAEANPRSLEATLGVMLPQMALLRWGDAIKTGRKVLADSPWDYNAHIRIMACEEAMSRWDDLAKHAAEVSARYPTDVTLLVYWARAEAALHNTRKAKDLYMQVLERLTFHIEAMKFIRNNP
jgi:tetratricopeptide (TPR) repeat protein